MATMTEPLLLTYAAAGELLSVSERTIRRLIERGQLQPVQLATGARRIRRVDLEQLAAPVNTDTGRMDGEEDICNENIKSATDSTAAKARRTGTRATPMRKDNELKEALERIAKWKRKPS